MLSTPSLRSFHIALEIVPMFVSVMDDGPFSSFQGTSSSASSFYPTFVQAIDGLMSLALRPQVVSQALNTSYFPRSASPEIAAFPDNLGRLHACTGVHSQDRHYRDPGSRRGMRSSILTRSRL